MIIQGEEPVIAVPQQHRQRVALLEEVEPVAALLRPDERRDERRADRASSLYLIKKLAKALVKQDAMLFEEGSLQNCYLLVVVVD